MTDYQEFLSKLQKKGSKPYKLNHCLGSRDAFNWVRKNKWQALGGRKCDKLLYSQIVSEVNKILAEMLLEGHEIEFPHQMGSLVLAKKPARVFYKDGELETNYWTDWQQTVKLMYEDSEAYNEHMKIKRVQPYIYRIRYYIRKAKYRNRRFYKFHPNRSLVRTMGKTIESGRMNAEQVEYY